eukprot:TRINITY_DN71840_c0_g1_i1.p1 TRINITY_DN71840_c0_g1~~TRINITY_DN71840_c0_g1_i1.p1  ORF type:complete len:375 (-),score=60.51 TRINITY_DN71840_c0_g1_i1:35-1159(-)
MAASETDFESERAELLDALRGTAGEVSFPAIERALRGSRLALEAEHAHTTKIWRSPLSLFSRRSAPASAPDWAIGCAETAQALVAEACEVGDLAAIYERQVQVALESGEGGLHRIAVREVLEQLQVLTDELRDHVPLLLAARAALDSPDTASKEAPSGLAGFREASSARPRPKLKRECILEPADSFQNVARSVSARFSGLAGWAAASALSLGGVSTDSEVGAPPPELGPEEGEVRLRAVYVRAGTLIDELRFDYSDGTHHTLHCGLGGTWQAPFKLASDEHLVEIRGKQGWFFDSVCFVTSRGRKSIVYGKDDKGTPFQHRASPSTQIWTVACDLAGRIERLVEKPAPAPSPSTSEQPVPALSPVESGSPIPVA